MVSEMRMNNCRMFTSGEDERRERRFAPAKSSRSWSRERGSVTIMTAILLVGLCLVLGLSIDVSRIYMVRSGLQNAADAAALAAARELNSGTGGLAGAVTQAQAAALQANQYGLNRTGAAVPNTTISKVEFSTSLAANATWYDNTNGNNVPAGVETSIKYVRVTTQTASVSMLFAAQGLGSTHVEQRTAIAGMSVGLNSICGFFPVIVALSNPTPPNGTLLTLKFTQGSGSDLTIFDQQYAVVAVTGNGSNDLAVLAAGGIPGNNCYKIGQGITATSSNQNNGPDRVTSGTNTRFDIYPNSNGSPLQPGTYPPDTNINQSITATQYLNRSPFTAPSDPGQDERRILLMPIVNPQPTGGTIAPVIVGFGAFFIRDQAVYQGQCQKVGQICGDLDVEYLGNYVAIGGGGFDPNAGSTSLSKPVLYR
jgi:Flp pilus assembly protein TadG